jgi:diguanylate cyclase (GGDEF)-like protein
MVDLDGFKPINDIYGHSAGDEVLIQVSARLKELMEGRGVIARVGGDEFAVFAPGLESEAEVLALGQDMKRALEEPIKIGDIVARLTCSSGFSLYPASGTDLERLIDRADMALYRAKAQERGGSLLFNAELRGPPAFERATIEQELRACHRQPAARRAISSRLSGSTTANSSASNPWRAGTTARLARFLPPCSCRLPSRPA